MEEPPGKIRERGAGIEPGACKSQWKYSKWFSARFYFSINSQNIYILVRINAATLVEQLVTPRWARIMDVSSIHQCVKFKFILYLSSSPFAPSKIFIFF